MNKPVIGITTSQKGIHPTPNNSFQPYYDAVKNAGGVPRTIGLGQPLDDLDALIAGLDGMILSGGGDVQTSLYQGDETKPVVFVSKVRDSLELDLIQRVLAADLPLLGICRGLQVMNVALGGTLITDLYSEQTRFMQHNYPSDVYPRDHIAHEVTFVPGSRLADIYQTGRITVNSRHHQAVLQPAASGQVTAYASDGLIEAVELPGAKFTLGVQWHPENLQAMPGHHNLFKAFIAAAGV